MSIATMADRTLPLAERVQAALLCWDMDDAHEAARAELIADVAAADRLARAMFALDEASDAPIRLTAWRGLDPLASDSELVDAAKEATAAHLAYRARMAQGVADA